MVFIFLCFRTSHYKKSTWSFNGPVWTWEISPKNERVLLTNFRELSNGCILIIYGEPLNKHISKLKYFPNLLDITQLRNTKDLVLHVVCYEERACQLLKFSMSQEVKRGLLAALIIKSSQKSFFNVFSKTNAVLFTYYQR